VRGSIVLLLDVLDDVLILRPDDFHDDGTASRSSTCALHEANKKIDPTLLVDRLVAMTSRRPASRI
jgi:hypothetical protein